ncbi:MAG: sugar phosphate nucleotidyltransferase [Pseudomonadota bacterium]
MRKAIAMIFAGGRVEDLSVLTERRPKSAVVFAGIYRTIDFALTNLANAGIGQVGILTQYRPSSLMDHVGTGMAWDLTGTTRGVRFLPPYLGPQSAEWYRGPADALFQNIDFIERTGADDVLAVSGDHVYQMDYQPLLNFHHEHGADLTVSFTPVKEGANRFGIGEINAAGQLINFTEKPRLPRTNLASMSVYVFRREVLVEELLRAVRGDEGARTFQIHEVMRRMMPRRRAYGWIHHGSWEYARTIDEYYGFHRRLLGTTPGVSLDEWHVRSNIMARRTAPPPPAKVLPAADVADSLISAGCVIEGIVRGSVLSPGVRIGKGAQVIDSVLWHDVVVEEGAVLSGVVCDKRTVFGRRSQVGTGPLAACEEMPGSLSCGATVVGMDVHIPPEARIGRNCIVHPEAQESDLGAPVSSGKSVWPASSRKEGVQ